MKLQREREKGSREARRPKEGGVITSFSVGQMCVFSTFCDIKSLLIIFLFPGVDCRPTSSPIRAVQRSQRRFDRCAALHISQGYALSSLLNTSVIKSALLTVSWCKCARVFSALIVAAANPAVSFFRVSERRRFTSPHTLIRLSH